MAESSAVVAKTLATAAQYNNLRNDVLSTTLGHMHDGTNGRVNILLDDIEIIFGTGSDASIFWSDGDASNHTLVLALGNSNQALHLTDLGAKATDWNVSADTHPSLYLHSNTTPATDYLKIGAHDGTTALIDVVGGTTLDLNIAGTTYAILTATNLKLIDDVGFTAGTGSDAELLWSTGDASNHSLVLALGDSNQSLHITDVGAKATDWNVSAETHPTVYVHSNLSPATNYTTIRHTNDGIDSRGVIDSVGGELLLQVNGTSRLLLSSGGGVMSIQESTTAAIPAFTINQGDVSEEMIEFVCTIGTGNGLEAVGAKALTTTHFIKVTLPGGLTRYIPCGTIA